MNLFKICSVNEYAVCDGLAIKKILGVINCPKPCTKDVTKTAVDDILNGFNKQKQGTRNIVETL